MSRNQSILIAVVGLLALAGAIVWYIHRSDWVSTEGRVTSLDEDYDSWEAQRCDDEGESCDGYSCDITIAYLDRHLYEHESGSCWTWSMGEKVDVYYEPHNPALAVRGWPWVGPLLLGVAGIGAAAFGGREAFG